MSLPFDQVVRQQRFINDHPEWSIHAQDGNPKAALNPIRTISDANPPPNAHP